MSEEQDNQEGGNPINLEVKCAYARTVVNERSGYKAQLTYECKFWQECPLQIIFLDSKYCGAEFNPKKYKIDPNQRTVVNPKGNTFRSMLDLSKPENPED